MKITFRQVDAFRTVVSTGSVTEAAAMLQISQPAVSRLIADLEAEVGFQLFQRAGRVLVPTEEARLLVLEVRQAVSGMEHIKQAVQAIASFGHARLNLITSPALSTHLAPDLIGKFTVSRPDAMARLEIEADDDTVEWMVSQNFDFGLTTSIPANPSFESLVIRDEDAFCVVPTGHHLAGRSKISPPDLSNENFISYMPSSRFRFDVDAFFDAKCIDRRLQYETRTTDSICRLVARGLGVSVVGSSKSYLDTMPNCVTIPFDAPLNFHSVLFWSNKAPMTAVAKEFLQIAKTAVVKR
jgi:DNA-binding transcriptional LysR family regulator